MLVEIKIFADRNIFNKVGKETIRKTEVKFN